MKAGSTNPTDRVKEARNGPGVARRAIIEPVQEDGGALADLRARLSRMGRAERQLAYSYLITAVVVVGITVVLPELLALVRNF